MSAAPRDLLVSVSAAKTRLSELVRVAQSRDVRLLRYGAPAAVLVSVARYDALCDRLAAYEAGEVGAA